MHHQSANDDPKGWYFGPWNSNVPIPVGFANEGIALTHFHEQMTEIYMVAQGTSTILIDGQEVHLKQGDAIAVEPNEVHTFTASSDDYFHFVIQVPFRHGDKVVVENL